MKHRYNCKSCGLHIDLPPQSKFCPVCGGTLECKAELLANKKIKELQELLPILEAKYNEFANLYVKFKASNETLRTYASRGIISRESIPEFKPAGLTELFYESRKHKKKEGDTE